VPAGQWYSNGILWAAEVNIVQGTGDNLFAPNANVTREQLAVMLYNYAKYAGITVVDASRSGFADRASVSDWAEAAVDWAVSVNLITGKPGNLLDPQGNATRAEVATILMRFMSL
jgi:hypothetical protein